MVTFMLPCNMIRSRQPRPATSSSLRRLPLSPFSYTYRPILCLSPLLTSPNSTHPSQLDTPVSSQPLCYQSHPHAFRHTWGCASVSTFNFELSTPYRSFCTRPHQYHSAPLSRPLFSYSYALFCHGQNTNSRILNHPRTLCAKHPGWGRPPARSIATHHSPILLHALRDKYHFRRTIRQRRLVEIPIHRAHAKPAARQQVLHLVPEEIPQRPRKHQTLLLLMRVLHIKNHFHVIPLLRAVERFHTFHDSHLPSVWHRVFRHQPFLLVRGVVHSLRVRLENVQDQPPAALAEPPASCPQVLSHRFKAGDLRVNLQKVLHRAKRNNDHAEFFAEIEPRHVALHKMKAFARFRPQLRAFFVAALQHPLGNIESGYAMPVRRQRQRDPSRAAPQLKHGIPILMHRGAVKRDIPRSPAHHRRLIVVVRNKSVVQRRGHELAFLMALRLYTLASLLRFSPLFQNRVRLDLHEHFRRDQLAHFHHARRGPDFAEKFSVRPPDQFPLGNVGHVDPRPHHILQSRPRFPQRRFYVPNRLYGLRIRIAYSDDLPVRPRRRGSRNRYHIPDPYRPRVPHDRLPGRPAGNILPCQVCLLRPTLLCRCGAAC